MSNEYELFDNYKKPVLQKLNDKLSILIYNPKSNNENKERIVGLLHFGVDQVIYLRSSSVYSIVQTLKNKKK